MKFKQYNVIRINSINRNFDADDFAGNKRVPKIGDIATIIEI